MANKIHFTDVTLRDGQQSLTATRMTTPQALKVLKKIDEAGFHRMELWGGATLDSCIRFLNEDPWQRLETFAGVLGGREKIQALLRGQNLFAYQPYPDDLVIAFIKQAVESGVGVMRIFDALNDWRNLQTSILAVKAFGAKAEGAISYTVSPVHTTQYFIDYGKKLVENGVDAIAIKDMAGLLHPKDALQLIGSLVNELPVPIALHTHATTGVSLMNAVIAMQAGIYSIDTAITPFAGGTSHNPVEVLIVFAEEMGLEHGLDKDLILDIQNDLFGIAEELKEFNPYFGTYYQPVHYDDVDRNLVQQIIKAVADGTEESIELGIQLSRQLLDGLKYPTYDDSLFASQIPGGMLTNLQNQLKQMGQLERMDEIMAEIPAVRKDVGYVPLVTPTSQIVGSQATFNVLSGQRYSFVSNEFKMILRGEFGKTPAPCNPELVNQVLEEGAELMKYRVASYLHPILEDEVDLPFIHNQKDLLLHHLLGTNADQFLEAREKKEIREPAYV
jgi:pyruvate/oxaloacetate carboxyltransferase